MKTYLKIFTVLPIALIATSCFAATENQNNTVQKLKSENLAKEITNSAKRLKLGDSISFENGHAAKLQGAEDALKQWSDTCNALAGKNGIKEVQVHSTEQNGQKIYTCSLIKCQDDYDESKNKKFCVQKNSITKTVTNAEPPSEDNKKTEQESTTSKEGLEAPTAEAEKKYEEAKEKEQSLANRTLTAATTAATGIGGMELAMGLSQQKADKDADADMAAYIETFRCSYGDGKSVKGGTTEIELPGGNDQTMMNYRAEYLALAADLKERKTALGMAPGIESEIIMDKATMGLYDDENVGITGGNYESLYRAKMLDSEEDQAKIDANKNAAKNRVIAGAVVGGVGVVGGIVGDSLINGKLGEKIKAAKEKKEKDSESYEESLATMKACLKSGGAKNTDKLEFKKFTPSILNFENINCNGTDWKKQINGRDAQDLFTDSDEEQTIVKKLTESFGKSFADKLLGVHYESTIMDDVVVKPTKPDNASQEFNFKYFEVPKTDPDAMWKKTNCQWPSSAAFNAGYTATNSPTVCKEYHEARCDHYVMGDAALGGCNAKSLSASQSDTCNYCTTRENKERICIEELRVYCYEKGFLYPEQYRGAQQEMNADWFEYACLSAKGTPSGGKCLCNGNSLAQDDNSNVIKFKKCE